MDKVAELKGQRVLVGRVLMRMQHMALSSALVGAAFQRHTTSPSSPESR